MRLTHCDRCGRMVPASELHYFEGGRYSGVQWLCTPCHPEHPQQQSPAPAVCAPELTALMTPDVRLAVLGSAIAAGAAEAVEDVTAAPVRAHVGWPKGMKRQGLRGPAIRPDAG